MTAGSGKELKDFIIEQNGVEILPVAAIYGGNASGKSNIIEALSDFQINIMDSNTYGEKENFLVIPFLFDENLTENPTEMEIQVAIDDKEYKYGYLATKSEVLEEWLYERKLSKNETSWKVIFEREKLEINFGNSKEYKKLDMYNSFIEKKMLVLSFLSTKEKNKINAFSLLDKWIEGFYIIGTRVLDGYRVKNSAARRYFEDKTMKENCVKFIKEFDPNFEDFIIKEEIDSKGEKKYNIFSIHNKKEYPLGIESEGSQKLIWTFIHLFWALDSFQLVVAFDELDSQLHPLILRRIVRMFHDKSINKMNSQLIFTSHNLIILDNQELRRDEIYFTEKDEKGFTTLYSLADFKTDEKDVRSDLNYGKHYLAGRFGAIPYMNYKEEQ
jgi:hypothetical protein